MSVKISKAGEDFKLPDLSGPDGPGRPSAPISPEVVYQLARTMCPESEAAAVFGVSEQTFRRRLKQSAYASAWEQGRAVARRSIRLAQMKLGLSGDRGMLIWLGKQYLGQSEKGELRLVAGDHVEGEDYVVVRVGDDWKNMIGELAMELGGELPVIDVTPEDGEGEDEED